MLLPRDVEISACSPEELRQLVADLLGERARLRAENAALREEIARLKGHKGRPKIKPSGMERATPERGPGAKTKRSKRSTTARRVIHEERVLAIAAPPGSRFKGYEDFVVQDLRLAARVIRYRRQRWLSPTAGRWWPHCRPVSKAILGRNCAASCCCSITRARSRPSGSRRSLPAWAWRSPSARWCGS
jgi:hypothetical protein